MTNALEGSHLTFLVNNFTEIVYQPMFAEAGNPTKLLQILGLEIIYFALRPFVNYVTLILIPFNPHSPVTKMSQISDP